MRPPNCPPGPGRSRRRPLVGVLERAIERGIEERWEDLVLAQYLDGELRAVTGDGLLRDSDVSHFVSTDAEPDEDRMEKINVRVPESLLATIDDEWEHRGYSSRSEAIRRASGFFKRLSRRRNHCT